MFTKTTGGGGGGGGGARELFLKEHIVGSKNIINGYCETIFVFTLNKLWR